MPGFDKFISADRLVQKGLETYDAATERLLESQRIEMAEGGASTAEIDRWFIAQTLRIALGRDKLHRKLWVEIFPKLASQTVAEPAVAET